MVRVRAVPLKEWDERDHGRCGRITAALLFLGLACIVVGDIQVIPVDCAGVVLLILRCWLRTHIRFVVGAVRPAVRSRSLETALETVLKLRTRVVAVVPSAMSRPR